MSWDVLLFKNLRDKRCTRLKFQQKIEEFDVKHTIFPYNELRLATRDFHEGMIWEYSSSGAVYKGVLPNGRVMAVEKTFFHCTIDEFSNKAVLLKGIKHKNLLTIKGSCLHDHQWLLVYEYAENFDVYHNLLDKGPRRQMVAWPVRFKICLGVAQGLHHLHALAHPRIIHRNITARTVFLDRQLDPKIGGFSLALLFPDKQSHILMGQVAGTRGYMAPEYANYGKLSEKVDVYSFGVLCLEIISGRNNWEMDQLYVHEWAWRLHEADKLLEFVDPTLDLTDFEVRDVQ